MSIGLRTAVVLVVLVFFSGTSRVARAEENTRGTCHALLVGGHPGSAVYARRYRDWLRRFHSYLTKEAGVPESDLLVISDDDGFEDRIVGGKASAETIPEAFKEMAGKVRPADQFVLIVIGHGAITVEPPTFVVRGPDPDATLFARGLDAIKARNQVVLNFTSSSGAFVRHLRGRNRVNIAANSATEGVEPVYAEFFLRGLESRRADGMGEPEAGGKDGVVTLLEAYNWATYQTALWISRLTFDQDSGSWKLDGTESVEIFERLCTGPEGVLGARRLAPGSRRDVPDEVVRIRPGRRIPYSWASRRALSEHASLEDCDEEAGISALSVAEAREAPVRQAWDVEPVEFGKPSGPDFRPLAGRKKGEPGHLARRVVLGRPRLFFER